MEATYLQPDIELLEAAPERGYAISQPDGGELGPTSASRYLDFDSLEQSSSEAY